MTPRRKPNTPWQTVHYLKIKEKKSDQPLCPNKVTTMSERRKDPPNTSVRPRIWTNKKKSPVLSSHSAIQRRTNALKRSGPSCSKLMTSLVNVSLKFTSSETQICWCFLLKKMWKATHIFSTKNIRILYIESAKTVNEMTLNELVKLTTLWTTGPGNIAIVWMRGEGENK